MKKEALTGLAVATYVCSHGINGAHKPIWSNLMIYDKTTEEARAHIQNANAKETKYYVNTAEKRRKKEIREKIYI